MDPSGNPRPDQPVEEHRFRSPLIVMVGGYIALTAVMLAIGLLLTHALDGSVGRWDEHVNRQLAAHRTSGWNDVTKFATSAVNTLPVIVAAAVISGGLALRRRFREASFLILALVLEITVFLSVTFIVARPRPDVPRLNSTPATSSFPSGHTAAATVLCVGVALIVTCCTGRRLLRVLAACAATVIAAFVGFARVYRGLHHPSDVFVGAAFGLACLAVAALATRRVPRRDRGTVATDASTLPARTHPVGAPTGRPQGLSAERRRVATQ